MQRGGWSALNRLYVLPAPFAVARADLRVFRITNAALRCARGIMQNCLLIPQLFGGGIVVDADALLMRCDAATLRRARNKYAVCANFLPELGRTGRVVPTFRRRIPILLQYRSLSDALRRVILTRQRHVLATRMTRNTRIVQSEHVNMRISPTFFISPAGIKMTWLTTWHLHLTRNVRRFKIVGYSYEYEYLFARYRSLPVGE